MLPLTSLHLYLSLTTRSLTAPRSIPIRLSLMKTIIAMRRTPTTAYSGWYRTLPGCGTYCLIRPPSFLFAMTPPPRSDLYMYSYSQEMGLVGLMVPVYTRQCCEKAKELFSAESSTPCTVSIQNINVTSSQSNAIVEDYTFYLDDPEDGDTPMDNCSILSVAADRSAPLPRKNSDQFPFEFPQDGVAAIDDDFYTRPRVTHSHQSPREPYY